MSFNKKTRELVYNKTNGHCAYCGCDLPKRWHIDHIEPAIRDLKTGEYDKSLDDIDNLLPSCPSCNIIKSSQPLESFRKELENMYDSVMYNGTVKVAERYGIIERHKKPIIFYFEKNNILIKGLKKVLLIENKNKLEEYEKKLKNELEDIKYAESHKNVIWSKEWHDNRVVYLKDKIKFYKDEIKKFLN